MTLKVTDNQYGQLSQRQLGFLFLILSPNAFQCYRLSVFIVFCGSPNKLKSALSSARLSARLSVPYKLPKTIKFKRLIKCQCQSELRISSQMVAQYTYVGTGQTFLVLQCICVSLCLSVLILIHYFAHTLSNCFTYRRCANKSSPQETFIFENVAVMFTKFAMLAQKDLSRVSLEFRYILFD